MESTWTFARELKNYPSTFRKTQLHWFNTKNKFAYWKNVEKKILLSQNGCMRELKLDPKIEELSAGRKIICWSKNCWHIEREPSKCFTYICFIQIASLDAQIIILSSDRIFVDQTFILSVNIFSIYA